MESGWCFVGESGSSIEDNSLISESNPDGVEACVLLVFRGESSDFRAFGVGRGEFGLVPDGSMLRARGRALFFRPTPSPDASPLALALALGFCFGPPPPSQPSLPSSSSDESWVFAAALATSAAFRSDMERETGLLLKARTERTVLRGGTMTNTGWQTQPAATVGSMIAPCVARSAWGETKSWFDGRT